MIKLSLNRKNNAISYMALPILRTKYRFPSSMSVQGNLIETLVAEHYGVTIEQMVCKKRYSEFVRPRHVAMWLLRKYTKHSLKNIARMFGRKDHSSVIHAVSTIYDQMDTDPRLREDIRVLEMKIE